MDSSLDRNLNRFYSRLREENSGNMKVQLHIQDKLSLSIQVLENMTMRKRKMISKIRLSWMKQFSHHSVAAMIEHATRK
jgi:hypothetical protein